jgi:hypothetical protein
MTVTCLAVLEMSESSSKFKLILGYGAHPKFVGGPN